MILDVPSKFLKSDNNVKEYRFNFEHIFDQNSTQQDIFNELSQLIQSVIDGQNICIFAYGQTGSGKTFTIEGEIEDKKQGLLSRTMHYIFF